MDPGNPYFKQVELLVQMLPVVAKYDCFALRGGTAINLFVRDMPRLSVDIDLTYVPVSTREDALAEIDASLRGLKDHLINLLPGLHITGSKLPGANTIYKLLTQLGNTQVKIEISPVMRGVVNAPVQLETLAQTQEAFGYADVPVVSFNDLYAGKLCAALSRQHPRDLFDIKLLLENEGITDQLLEVFLVYLMCSNRPMSELLAPNIIDIKDAYENQFRGMTLETASLDELLTARKQLIVLIQNRLSDKQKQQLLNFKKGGLDWKDTPFPHAEYLPAIQWKIKNLNRMKDSARNAAIDKLKSVLYG